MGFGEIASQVIFYIAVIVLASSISAMLFVTVQKMSVEVREQGEVFKKLIGTDFEIINDPVNVPYDSSKNAYVFYVKNTGSEDLIFTNNTLAVLLNGSAVRFTTSTQVLKPGETGILYVYTAQLAGDNKLIVVSESGVKKSFEFTV
jgi:flagellar protein FlaG